MKIRLTENKLREIVNESIKELIDEGFLGDVWDNIKTGAQNDWCSFKNTFKGGNEGYKNDVINKYGKPIIKQQNQFSTNILQRLDYLYNKRNNNTITAKEEKELRNLEYSMEERDIFYRKSDVFGNRYIVGQDDYMNVNVIKPSFNPNGKIYKNLVSKYVDRNGQYLQGKNWKMLQSALIKYRNNRDALWEELLEMYGPGAFIPGGNNVNVG